MNRFRHVIVLTALIPAQALAQAPDWIWNSVDRHEPASAHFEQTFELSTKPKSARLIATGDFAALRISINGERVADLEAYDPPVELEPGRWLVLGENRLSLEARGVAGPSAIAARLSVDGQAVLRTGPGWDGAISFGKTRPERFEPNLLTAISPFDEYNQWKEASGADSAAGAKLSELPPGFEEELLRVAQGEEGSWVSLEFDPKGRLLIGREKQGILRLTLPKNAGAEIQVEVVNDELKECRGLLWAYDSLYANANNSKALYRLRDTTGDDRFDEVTLLKTIEGKFGHGRNDLALGPDGMIYSIHGDAVLPPEGGVWRTAPENERIKPQGYVARTDANGKSWEILARGLRNPYGIDFNPDGEMFTYDADNEGDIGLPLYRPTRVNHLVSGGNYGWRQADATWSWPVYTPDGLPTTLDIGRGSPTSVKFGTRSNFPQKWREALFVLDWAYGRVIAVHLTPRGASYHAGAETFLRGRPFNVTDLDFDADGAMYLITGGRKTQAALYRVRYSGKAAPEGRLTAQEAARHEFSATMRDLRRRLESGELGVNELWPHLDSPDPWIRNAARFSTEIRLQGHRDLHVDLKPESMSQGAAFLLASTRAGREISPHWTSLPATVFPSRADKLSLLRAYELGGESRSEIVRQFLPIYPNPDARLNREICKALVRLESPEALAPTLQLLAESRAQTDRLHYLEQLSHVKSGWAPEQRQTYFRALLHAKRFSNGDRNLPNYLAEIEERAVGNVAEPERAEFAAMLKDEAPPEPVAVDPTRDFVKNWQMRDFEPWPDGSRNLARGEKMFHLAQCSRCHQFGTQGTPMGPNLTMVGSRFSPRDLLASILEPSAVISEAHQNLLITKTDGTVVLGRLIRDDIRASELYVAKNPFAPNELTKVAKSEIEAYEPSPVSPMPPSLVDRLSREEILDLVAFLAQAL